MKSKSSCFVGILVSLLMCMSMVGSAQVPGNDDVGTQVRQNIQKAMEFVQERRFSEAIRLIRENQGLEPDYFNHVRQEAWIYGVWGVSLKREGNAARATPYLHKSIEKYDEAIKMAVGSQERREVIVALNHQKALIIMDLGDYARGHETLMQALQLDRTDVMTNYLLGIVLREHYAQLSQENKNPPKTMIDESDHYFEQATVYNFDGIVIPYAYFFTGVRQYQEARYDAALQNLQLWTRQIRQEKGDSLSQQDREFVAFAQQAIDEIVSLQSSRGL